MANVLVWNLVHRGVPLVAVLASLALLVVAAASRVYPVVPRDTAFVLFSAGVATWFAGMIWGVWVNR